MAGHSIGGIGSSSTSSTLSFSDNTMPFVDNDTVGRMCWRWHSKP
jgi:hypothetical protein